MNGPFRRVVSTRFLWVMRKPPPLSPLPPLPEAGRGGENDVGDS